MKALLRIEGEKIVGKIDGANFENIRSDLGSSHDVAFAGGGLFLTFRLGFFQFKYFPHIIKQTFGKILSKPDSGEGTLTPFQAATSALASTVGAANIIGVPVAIAFGGPGAIFGCG